jgi:protein-S-isoprenylcysteine O-methyltransferase Ste14
VSDRANAIIGSFIFFWMAPGTVAGVIPYVLTEWRVNSPLLGLPLFRFVGVAAAALGLATLVECFVRFSLEGRGTPGPIVQTKNLVVSGPYRRVRNPMYVSVLALIAGQAMIFGSPVVLAYAGAMWLVFHAAVVLLEEPRLRRKFGGAYDGYRANVRRWWPRLTAWDGRHSS